jgi:hypothetical protein
MKIKVVSQADFQLDGSDDPDLAMFSHAYGKARSKRFMIIEHGNDQLQWNFPPRTWNSDPDTNADAFDQVNLYFGLLSMDKQAAIFAEYRNIHQVLRSTNMQQDDCEDLIEAIRPMARALFDQIDPQHFYNWVWTSLKPRIPADINVIFNPETMPGTRERTYLLEDYKGLIPLAIIVRAACPFWFDFAALTKSVLSRELKDMLTYSLIEQSWPAQSDALARLEQFVDHTIGADRNNPAAVLMGIGSDDFVYWALTSLVINRLPVVDVMGVNNLTPVVSALYNYVRHRVTTIASSQPAIKNKFAETSYSADENNQSYLEGFRNRIALTVGQEALGDQYLERQIDLVLGARNAVHSLFVVGNRDPFSLLERVAPGIDHALVKDALESSKALHNASIADEQITIAAWLFHPYSQARTVGNLRKDRIVALLGLAQAVLLHHNKIDLARLVTGAYERMSTSGEGTRFIGESIAPLRAADRETYRSIFPMEQRSRNQKKVRNFVFEDVYELARSLQEYDINCTFSEATLKRVQGNIPNRTYVIPSKAVTMFMEYAKWLAERPMVRIDPDAVYAALVARDGGSKINQPFVPWQYTH